MARFVVILFICAVNLSVAHAQDSRPGFIINANGDSLAGFVDYRSDKSNSRVCYFKSSKQSKKVEYSPDGLRGYGFIDDKFYESKEITVKENGINKKVTFFMEAIVKGKASLYRHLDQFYLEKDSLIELPKNEKVEVNINGSTYMVDSKKYVGILNKALADCNLKADQINNDERSLTRLIQNYNRCKGSVSTVFKSNKPWAKFSPGIFSGVDQTSIKLAGFDDYSMQHNISMPFGISLEINAPRLNEKLFFDLELWYAKKSFQGYNDVSFGSNFMHNDLFANTSTLKVPLGLHFNFLQEDQTPYVKFGVLQYFTLDLSAQILTEIKYSTGLITTNRSDVSVSKRNPSGLWFATGYTKKIYSKISGFVELRYEIYKGFAEGSSGGTSLSFLIGLKF